MLADVWRVLWAPARGGQLQGGCFIDVVPQHLAQHALGQQLRELDCFGRGGLRSSGAWVAAWVAAASSERVLCAECMLQPPWEEAGPLEHPECGVELRAGWAATQTRTTGKP